MLPEDIAKTDQLLLPCVRRWFPENPIHIVEGRGATLRDSEGKEYIDLFASHGAATMTGYNHPAVVQAIQDQAAKLYSMSVDFCTSPSIGLAQKLVEIMPASLNRVFFANAGSEVVEASLFLAKKFTKKHEFVALYGAFHGRTHGARSLVGYAPYKRGVGPFLPGIVHLPSYYCYRCQLGLEYPDCDVQCAHILEDALLYESGDPAAFVVEPIQGTAGNIPAPDNYFKKIEKILDRAGMLLILDEIYTALGRTGKLFAFEHYGVVPDMITMSKSLGNGLPISALVTTDRIAQSFAAPEPVMYFTTFGSNPTMAAAALAVVNTILKERLWERAARLGEYWMKGLKELQEKHAIIGDVRGKGLMIGVELVKDRRTKEPAKDESLRLREEARKRGLLVAAGFGWLGNTIELHPPAVMTEDQVDRSLHILDESLRLVSSQS